MKTLSYSKVFVERLAESQADLYSFVASMLPFNLNDVDDVVQETNLSMIRDAENYDEARPFRPWMFTIALRRVQDFRRAAMKGNVVFNDETLERAAAPLLDDSSAEAEADHATLLKRLAECKKRLKEDQREMLDLRYTNNLTAEAIARKLKSTPMQVYNALAYSRRKLAECVRRLCRLNNDTPDEAPVSKMESAIARAVDGAPSSEARRQLEELADNTPDLTDYMDQMLIHHLLSHGWIKQAAEPAIPKRFSPALKWTATAAGLALLLAGGTMVELHSGFTAKKTNGFTPAETPMAMANGKWVRIPQPPAPSKKPIAIRFLPQPQISDFKSQISDSQPLAPSPLTQPLNKKETYR